jgi:hypothetical protein
LAVIAALGFATRVVGARVGAFLASRPSMRRTKQSTASLKLVPSSGARR